MVLGPEESMVRTIERLQKQLQTLNERKGKALLNKLMLMKSTGQQSQVPYKRLEQIRGYLCHLSIMIEVITPYLKDFHLALDKHLPQRNEEGWKLTSLEFITYVEETVSEDKYTRAQAETLLNAQEGNTDNTRKQVTPKTIDVDNYFW